MICQQITFPSSDGKNNVVAYYFLPEKEVTLKGILQISHGMCDYILRYRHMAEVLCDAGYVVCGNDHLGHGHTATSADDLGFFAESDGVGYVIDDLHKLTLMAKEKYPELPFTLIGHSMGSFLCRLYATRYGYELDNLVILGTGGPNPLLPFGMFLTRLIAFFRGKRHRSALVSKLAFSGYTSHYGKDAHPKSWITRDTALVDAYSDDPFSIFTFTASAYLDLFRMLKESNSGEWFESFPKGLRTLVASGTEDPVGDFGQGPVYVANTLKEHGVRLVDLLLYECARHELFNETNKDEFFADLVKWLENDTPATT